MPNELDDLSMQLYDRGLPEDTPIRKQLDKHVLPRSPTGGGAQWATVAYLIQNYSKKTGLYSTPVVTLVRYKRMPDKDDPDARYWQKRHNINISSFQLRDAAQKILEWADEIEDSFEDVDCGEYNREED
jgi:hypothetical protein